MDLSSFSGVDVEALRWLRTSPDSNEFKLLAGNTPLAALLWVKPHGSLALADTADAHWSLKRTGFLHLRITVRRKDETKDFARLSSHGSHHRIELAGGAIYDLKRAGLIVPAWKLLSRDGTELLHIEPVREGLRLEGGTIQVGAAARALPGLPLLLVLGWYFIVLAWTEDEAVAEWADHAESRF